MKVLIIDDEFEARKEYYEKIFKDFEITSVSEPANLQLASAYKEFKVIAIDLYLWSQTPKDAKSIISGIPAEIPIILISQRWNDSNGMPIEEISTYTNNKQVIKLISFQRIVGASADDVENICREYNAEILIELNSFYQYNNIPIKDDDTINILHIADMQFGGNISDSASFDVYTIYDYLEQNFLKPNMVLVAGDVAQKGLAIEYNEALKWFAILKEKLFESDNMKNRFVLTPGNHDVNFNLFAGFTLKYEFQNKCFKIPEDCCVKDKNTKITSLIYKESDCVKENIDQIVYNDFRHFAYELTGDERWLLSPNHFNLYVNNFENLGLRILSLNSNTNISPSTINDKKELLHRGAGIDQNACRKMLSTINNDELFTIVLSHMGPSELGKDNEDLADQWKIARNFLDTVKADLWLCGHNHSQKYIEIDDESANYIYKKPCVYAGSLRLGSSALPDGARRGFNIIQLIRKEGKVNSIKVIPFEICDNVIERKVKREKTYKYE